MVAVPSYEVETTVAPLMVRSSNFV